MRLKIGDNVILDSTGSTSTTPNKAAGTSIYFMFDNTEALTETADAIQWETTSDGATLRFWVHIDGDSYANMTSARNDVIAAVTESDGDTEVELSAGTTFQAFKLSDSTYVSQEGSCRHRVIDNTCNIFCEMRFLTYQGATGSTGGGEVDGLVGPIESSVQRGTYGGMTAQITATFKGDGTDDPLKKAQTWVNSIKTRTEAPTGLSWLPAKDVMRIVDETFTPIEARTDTHGGLARVNITFLEMDDDLTDLVANIRQCDITLDVVPLSAQAEAGGRARGFDVKASASFTVKTEKNTDFDAADDPSDTLTGELTEEELETALQLIWTKVKAEAGLVATGISEWQVLDVNLRPPSTNGRYEVAIDARAKAGSGNTVLGFFSEMKVTSSFNGTVVTDTAGTDWVYKNRRGFNSVVTHRYEVTQMDGRPKYQTPSGLAGQGWVLVDIDEDIPTSGTLKQSPNAELLGSDGPATYSVFKHAWTAIYRMTGGQALDASIVGVQPLAQSKKIGTVVGGGSDASGSLSDENLRLNDGGG